MSTGLLFAGGAFVQMKRRESISGFFSSPEYPFTRDNQYTMEIDSVVKDYDFRGSFDGSNEYVKQNAEKYCGCLGVSASKLIELIDNNDIYFGVPFFFHKWVVIYWDEKHNKHTEAVDVGDCHNEPLYDPWDKFKYMYLAYGGNPQILKRFVFLETIPYSEFQGRGVSIGGRSMLDEMMDKAVQSGVNAMGYHKQEP